jgi:chromosome segregation protein
MPADRRVTYLLQMTDKASPSLDKVAKSAAGASTNLGKLTADAQAAEAALLKLSAAQTAAAGSMAGAGRSRVQRAVSGPATAPAAPAAAPAGAAPTPAPAAPAPAPAAPAGPTAAQQAAAAKAAQAKAARDLARLERDLEKQRQADVRQSLGNIAGRAKLEQEVLDTLEQQLKTAGKLGQTEQDLLNRRRAAVAADAAAQQASLARRGVDPAAAFGARGTRSTTIGSGVLSGFFDQLFAGGANASKTLDDIRDSAGRADTSLKTLAGALGVVSPGAEAAATAAGDLVGSLEVLLTPAGATVGAMAAVAVGLGAAGAAATAATLHVAEVADALRELEQLGAPELIPPETVAEAEAAAAAIQAIRPALSAIAGVIAGEVAPTLQEMAVVAVAGALTIQRALADTELSAGALVESLGQAYVNGLLLPLRTVLTAIEAIQTLAADALAAVGGEAAAAIPRSLASAASGLGEGLDALAARLAAGAGRAARGIAEGARDGYRVGLTALTAEARADAEALVGAVALQRRLAKGDGGGGSVSLTDELSTSVAEVESSAEDAATAIERLRGIIADRGEELRSPWDELRSTFAEARLELAGLTTAAGPAGAALAGAAERAIDAAEARRTAELVGAGVEAANREIAAADAERRAQLEARAAAPAAAVDRFGASVGALERGNVVGALGAATGIPQVQVVGAALDALATLGELGEEELRQRGEDFARAVAAGLEVLPGLIIDIAPDLALALAEAVGDALLNLPDRIADAIYEAVTGRDANRDISARQAITLGLEANETGSPLTVALAGAVSAIRGDRSRVAEDLGSGLTLPPVTGGRTGRGGPVVLSLRGSGVGLAQAIDVDTGPYGRVLGER